MRAGEALDRGLDHDLRAAHGIGLREYEVLLHLAAFTERGRLRMSALAAQAPLSQSRVSRLVAALEARGLVLRTTAPADSRGVEVSLTDAGLQTLVAMQDAHHASLEQRFFAHLSRQDITLLAAITARLLRANE